MSRAGSKPPSFSARAEQVADLALHILEADVDQRITPGRRLVARRQPVGGQRHLRHMEQHRIGRLVGEFVVRARHRIVDLDAVPEAFRRAEAADLELVEGLPVADQHIGVDQRDLHLVVQRLDLRLGKLVGDVRDDPVPAGEHDMPGLDGLHLAVFEIGQRDRGGALRRPVMLDANDRSVEPQPRRAVGQVELRIVDRLRGRAPPSSCPAGQPGSACARRRAQPKRCRQGNGGCSRRDR